MKKGIKWLFLTSFLMVTIVAFLAEYDTTSFGQQNFPPSNRKPACSIFCGGSTPDYFNLFPMEQVKAGKCWGGPLPSDQADNYYKELSEEQKNSVCQYLKTAGKTNCPVFNALMQSCQQKESPEPDKECEKSDSPWLGSPPTDCKDFQGWQVQQTGSTVSLSVCGYNVFSKQVRTGSNYVEALKNHLKDTIGEKFCCDKFREAARTGLPCDPRKDVDCDGKPNSTDTISQSGFPDIGLNYTTAEGARIDPFPPGMDVGEIYPNQFSCQDCQWELMRGEMKCSPDGKQRHVYQAKWRCPSSGIEADTFRYSPATESCKK